MGEVGPGRLPGPPRHRRQPRPDWRGQPGRVHDAGPR
jgi:hypothetical protein